MNPTDIDFDLINPEVITRPEKCMVCDRTPDLYFGRLNFRQPGAEFPDQYCPMHKTSLADPESTITLDDLRLVPC